MKHGSSWTYDNRGCRCGSCTAAKVAAGKRRYIRSRHRLGNGHGAALDVDEVAVYRACHGDLDVRLNRTEMFEVFVYLDAHGYTAPNIAVRLGITSRTVERWRSRRRENAVRRAA